MRESEVTDQYWAVRALDFVTALEAASTCDGVLKLFREEIAQVGFHSLLMTIVNDRERDFWFVASFRARQNRFCGPRRNTIRGGSRGPKRSWSAPLIFA